MPENQMAPEAPPDELRRAPGQGPTKLDGVIEKLEKMETTIEQYIQQEASRARDLNLLAQKVQQYEGDITRKEMIKDYLIPIYDDVCEAIRRCQEGQSAEEELRFLRERVAETLYREGADIYECSKGQRFNRKQHHAVGREVTTDKNENDTIAEVKKSGFRLEGENGEILRAAEVVVNKYEKNS